MPSNGNAGRMPADIVHAIYHQPGAANQVVQANHVSPPAPPPPTTEIPGNAIPIDLETVLRLAEEHNAQIAVVRERLHENQVENEQRILDWLPKVYAGMGYFRHEGGIQNPDGTFVSSSWGAAFPGMELHTEWDIREKMVKRIDAERKAWQERGELKKITYETLLEAATTYVDLLAARRGEAIAHEVEQYAAKLLKRAEDLRKTDKSATILVEALQTEVAARRQAIVKLHQQGDAAAAQLAYLLGLPCDAVLMPAEWGFTPIDLVNASPPCDQLVQLVLASGPGIPEVAGLLAVIQNGLDQFKSPLRFVPTFQVDMLEGAFGAGPGANTTWDNRMDMGMQMRWNLTEWIEARKKLRKAQSGMAQAQLTYQDLCGKLTAGVKEAREAILLGKDQIALGAEQVRHASELYRLSDLRLKESAPGSSSSEVQQSIHALDEAHQNYLNAIRDHNKAQIRLLLLLGPGNVARQEAHGSPTPQEPSPATVHPVSGPFETLLPVPTR
jgi:outer membrane protein TolC